MRWRRTAKGDVVEVSRWLDGLNLSTNVVVLDFAAEVRDGRVGRIVCTKDVDSFLHLIGLVDVIDWRSNSMRSGSCPFQ